ncbi:hypothetical protein RUM43_000288 [Polyplax serrata]|uniref:RNA helicase n=1 Tax=Polyplax serrata TaxID=468196 RepID=A0AAN8SC58_POLSC
MPKKEKSNLKEAISEHVRIAVDVAIKNFLLSEQSELEFPSSLSAPERAHVHRLAFKHGLCSKSRGKRSNRFLTVYKREGSTIVQADAHFQLSRQSRQIVYNLLNKFPLTNRERQDLLPQTERDRIINPDSREINRALGRLPAGMAQVPPPPGCNQVLHGFRQTLPIWSQRDEIIRTIISNQVCIIQGETGSGKTTQVPQFILEHCRVTSKRCRMIVTEPRRIAVVNVCERVCLERDEKIGQNVGYQIRLESRISPMTVLTFCTSGVLLRTLMCGESSIANVTHIILDEVHERDKFCDFLLIVLRDLLIKFRNLHLILLSATLDTEIFSKYFNNCPVVNVPGRMFPVKEYFLEDVLKQTNYMTKAMVKVKKELKAKNLQKENLEKWQASINGLKTETVSVPNDTPQPAASDETQDLLPDKSDLEPALAEEMDKAIADAFLTGTEDAMTQLLYLILSENVSADYQHSQTAMTPLMVAAARNALNVIEQLLLLGANIWIKASNDKTALDWANLLGHKDAAELIQSYSDQSVPPVDDTSLAPTNETSISEEDKELLEVYHSSFNDENIDVDLLMALLIQIHCTQPKGAILVFLAGYDDIVTVRERIIAEDKKMSEHMKYIIYTLHSNMQTGEQRKVFKATPHNVRKIILSTNIAETSLNIDDVIYVIDSGKMKEKSFDPLTNVSGLKKVWISQACAVQRKGRAGRTQPGICYHLFSSVRYGAMEAQSTPELFRVPLQELCLHSKLLAPPNTPIAEFLSKAIEPPPFLVTRSAVQHLKTIDALDTWEDLTELGLHLLDLPVEPRLGKMLMYGCVLKCLDPILTIVCCLAYKDPFILPAEPRQKRELHLVRQKFAAGSFSDHMVLLRAFQAWQQARGSGWEKTFCEKNFISAATMEMVTGTRAQLLAQLRASGFVRSRPPGDIRDLNSNSENWAVVKAALCAGLYPNLARVDREQAVLRTKKECKVQFHSTSTIRELPKNLEKSVEQLSTKTVERLPTDWVMYEELGRMGRFCHLRTCTLVSPLTVAIFSGPSRLPLESVCEAEVYRPDGVIEPDSDSETEEKTDVHKSNLKIDDWVLFKIDTEAAQLALQLRQKWHSLFLRKMKSPGKPWLPLDDAVVKTVVSVLSAEEQALNLTQPQGVGQRPRPCNIEHVKDDDFFSTNQNLLLTNSDRKGGKKTNGNQTPNSPASSQCGEGNDSKANFGGFVGQQLSNKKYFVIKAQSIKAIDNFVTKKMWTFAPNTERKINRALKDGKEVYIMFSVQGSGNFQGTAKLSNATGQSINSNQIPLQWVKRGNIPFQATRHLFNPLNENRRVQSSRDGQELEANVGAALCSLWDKPCLNKLYGPNPLEESQEPNRLIRGFQPHPAYDGQFYQRNQK